MKPKMTDFVATGEALKGIITLIHSRFWILKRVGLNVVLHHKDGPSDDLDD